MRQSESIAALSKALAIAQGEIENATKDATNGHFNTHYATLATALTAIREPFSKNGLSLVQATEIPASGPVILTTRLLHSSGEWLEGEYPVQPVKNDPQGMGSALTYARRYTAMAMAGIAPEDDDGNAGSAGQAPAYQQPVVRKALPPPEPPPEVDAMVAERIVQAIEGAKTSEELKALIGRNTREINALKLPLPDSHKQVLDAASKRKEQLTQKEGTAA